MAKEVPYPGSPVVPLLHRARTYRVISLSQPDTWRVVDLNRDSCTCPATVELCRHKRWALAFEAQQREFQEKMPTVVARIKTEVTGQPHLPRVPEMTEDELKAVFA